MKEWWSNRWPDIVINVAIFLVAVGTIVAFVWGILASVDRQRACDECIETYCNGEVIDGCDCAQCIVLCD